MKVNNYNFKHNKRLQSRRRYTIEQKLSIVREYQDARPCFRQVVLEKHNIRYDLVYRWIQSKDKFLIYDSNNTACTRTGSPRFHKLDRELFDFCIKMRLFYKNISFNQLVEFAESLEVSSFRKLDLVQRRNYIHRFLSRSKLEPKNFSLLDGSRGILSSSAKFRETSKFLSSLKDKLEKVDRKNIVAMDYIPLWFEFPKEVSFCYNGEEISATLKSHSSLYRAGVILSASADGNSLMPYAIFPSLKNSTLSKFTLGVNSSNRVLEPQCGLQENAFMDTQQFYNWTQTVFRPFAYPKHYVHHLLVPSLFEGSIEVCQKQLDKCQTQTESIPFQLTSNLHPLHLNLCKPFMQSVQDYWSSWIKKIIIEGCIPFCDTELGSSPVTSHSPPALYESTELSSSSSEMDLSPEIKPTLDTIQTLPSLIPNIEKNLSVPASAKPVLENPPNKGLFTNPTFFKLQQSLEITLLNPCDLNSSNIGEASLKPRLLVQLPEIESLLPYSEVYSWIAQSSNTVLNPEAVTASFRNSGLI